MSTCATIAHARDGFACRRTSCPRRPARGLVTILKSGGASTLDIREPVKALMPQIKAQAPPGLDIELLFDSRSRARGDRRLVKESVIAAAPHAMILVFLGAGGARSS